MKIVVHQEHQSRSIRDVLSAIKALVAEGAQLSRQSGDAQHTVLLDKLADVLGMQDISPFAGLLTLPHDILFEILKFVSFRDILRLRQASQLPQPTELEVQCLIFAQTNKFLKEMSHARLIWLNLFNKYSNIKPFPLQLERPIERYPSGDLERLILRWKRAEWHFTKEAADPPLRRDFSLKNAKEIDHHSMYLLKGGRWLLFKASNQSLYYCDLDAITPTPTLLISPDATPLPGAKVAAYFSLDESQSSIFPSFTLAYWSFDSARSDNSFGISVWRVSFLFEADRPDRAAGLDATCLSTFLHKSNQSLTVLSITLSGPELAFTLWSHIVVVSWVNIKDPKSYSSRILKHQAVSKPPTLSSSLN
ncbi:unnamed protein product [Cyclocybe aegerita]|uniref:F-box domain-containing protein n=1 Tax=Cyclocybe aegerita TaxID=1973307 RepID=A0A8S0W3R1_CYCAE|nr:unnamed protein product [Cyclocybe aegerita]